MYDKNERKLFMQHIEGEMKTGRQLLNKTLAVEKSEFSNERIMSARQVGRRKIYWESKDDAMTPKLINFTNLGTFERGFGVLGWDTD